MKKGIAKVIVLGMITFALLENIARIQGLQGSAYAQNVEQEQIKSPYEKYKEGISVGFASMGDIKALSLTVSGEYFIVEQSVMLHKGKNYRIELVNSIFTLYEEDKFITQINYDFTIKPLDVDSFIIFSKNSHLRNFSGSMVFKKRQSFFLPINILNMESYVKGVIPFEMGEEFPLEALKAQAVAARTYGLGNKNGYTSSGYDVRDDTYSQVYNGFVDTAVKCNIAVASTKGQILTYGGEPINALFSASNGGYTEKVENIWNESYPYLIDEVDEYDIYEKWKTEKTIEQIDRTFKEKHKELKVKQFLRLDISNLEKYKSGRILKFPIIYLDNDNQEKSYSIEKNEGRTLFGLKSALYEVSYENGKYIFSGSGYGHGAGMSQWGAYERAKSGQDYKKILSFYYKGTALEDTGTMNPVVQFQSRIGGDDRYATALKIAERAYSSTVENVVLASGNDFPDALCGAALANKVKAPILLINKTPQQSEEVLEYINSKVNKLGTVYILGGKGVIPDSFLERIKQYGFEENQIVRVGGENRNITSYLISTQVNAAEGTPIVIAPGRGFADALTISPIAAMNGWPIFLSNKEDIEIELEQYIIKNKPSQVYLVGGEGVLENAVQEKIKNLLGYGEDKVIRLGGKDRYETSRIINTTFFPKPSEIILASGANFPDSLSGSVYAALKKAPILLVNSDEKKEAEKYLHYLAENENSICIPLTVLGLSGAIDDDVVKVLGSISK